MTNHYEAAREAHRRATLPCEECGGEGIHHDVDDDEDPVCFGCDGTGLEPEDRTDKDHADFADSAREAWPAVEEVVAAAIELRAAIANATVKVEGFEPRIFVGEEKGAVIMAADARLREALGRLTGEGVR